MMCLIAAIHAVFICCIIQSSMYAAYTVANLAAVSDTMCEYNSQLTA
ncbi:MAG: hypothetical protein AAB110_08895 [Candidatus Desantisbacteria bacterium]